MRRAVVGRAYEEMHFLFNANLYGLHGPLQGNLWLPWVTRGMYLGQRRLMLSAQVCASVLVACRSSDESLVDQYPPAYTSDLAARAHAPSPIDTRPPAQRSN